MKFCTFLWKKTATQKIFCIAVMQKCIANCDAIPGKLFPVIPQRAHATKAGFTLKQKSLIYLTFQCFACSYLPANTPKTQKTWNNKNLPLGHVFFKHWQKCYQFLQCKCTLLKQWGMISVFCYATILAFVQSSDKLRTIKLEWAITNVFSTSSVNGSPKNQWFLKMVLVCVNGPKVTSNNRQKYVRIITCLPNLKVKYNVG